MPVENSQPSGRSPTEEPIRPQRCPLCDALDAACFHQDAVRTYFRCRACQLVFLAPEQLPTVAEEKACYDLHENDPGQAGYRRFLSRLSDPMLDRLAAGSSGLDFGCGPGPALAMMLSEAGHSVDIYDPIYVPDARVWSRNYDFVTATEVFEHLHRPGVDLPRVWRLLRPGGWLGVMTKRVHDAEVFARWHYKNDPTHVVFFSRTTFEWLAQRWGALLSVLGPDVVLLQKPLSSEP